jgi:group I intron endonuclease
MSQNYCIYQLTSPDGKSYIGRTNNINKRIISHKYASSCCSILFKAIQQYGIDNFKVVILRNDLTRAEANLLEIEYIAKHNTLYPQGYNRNTGEETGFKVCSAMREAMLAGIAKAKA